MSRRKKLLIRHNKVAKKLLNSTFFKKNTEAATGGAEAVTGGILKNFANFTGKQSAGVFFYEVASLQPASFYKRDSNTSAFCEVCETFKNTYYEEYLQTTAARGVL